MAAVHANNVGRRDRKVVFKSVLDNPFQIRWPHVPLNIQNAALAALVNVLDGVSEYHIARQNASRKRKRALHDKARKDKASARKKRKLDAVGDGDGDGDGLIETDAPDTTSSAMDLDASTHVDLTVPPPPPVFSHLTFGINEVTKRLESQSNSLRPRTTVHPLEKSPAPDALPPPLTLVFVCRADVDPPLLIAHFPELVASCNVPSPSSPPPPVLLIPLPKHAEHTLAEALGMRRVSVLALDSTTPSLTTLSSLFFSVQPPSAPWLTSRTTAHVPTHIKQLCTTAPRDMRAAKRERTQGRQAAKQKKKDGGVTEKVGEGEGEKKGEEDGKNERASQANKGAEGKKDDGKSGKGKEKPSKGKKRVKITVPSSASSKNLLPT